MHRGFIRTILALFLIITIPAAAEGGKSVWEMGRAGTVHPVLYSPGLRCCVEPGKYTGLVSSISNPYSIPGLYRMGIYGFSGLRFLDIRASWSHIDHRLYRNDVCAIRMTATEGGSLNCGILLGADSRGITGSSRENHIFLDGVAAFRAGEIFSAGFRMMFHDTRRYRLLRYRLIISIEIERISLLVNRNLYSHHVSETAAGLELALSDQLCLLSGYSFRTGEISFGLFCRSGISCFGISWSDHPVLGSTAGCGIGGFRTR